MNLEDRIMEKIRRSMVSSDVPPDTEENGINRSEWKGIQEEEIRRLNDEVECRLSTLAREVYSAMVDDEQGTAIGNAAEIMDNLLEIRKLNRKIAEKEIVSGQSDRSDR